MNPTWIIGIVVIIVIVSYSVFNLVSYVLIPTPIQPVGPEQLDIAVPAQVATSTTLANAWTSTSGSTLMFFILAEINDRTTVSGNEYANVVKIGSKQAFQILVAPDAGRSYTTAPARLEVITRGNSIPEYIEFVDFPLQKWVSVVIVKNGRKFNIYIDGKLTISHTCLAMPDIDVTQALTIGDSRLSGKIALISLVPSALNSDTIKEYYIENANGDGQPQLTSGASIIPTIENLTSLTSFFLCPGGNCSTVKIPGPMQEWSSPYA
jgi:hypothetical protein